MATTDLPQGRNGRDTARPAPGARTSSARSTGPTNRAVVAVKNVFVAESSPFYTILGVTLFLVVFGVVMVLSSSSVEQYAATHDFFGAASRQGLYAVLGVPLMLIVSRVPARLWRKWAMRLLGAALALQLLVYTPLGIDVTAVVRTGILPQINTGMAGKVAGTGQVGAGLVTPPAEVVPKALTALAARVPAVSPSED